MQNDIQSLKEILRIPEVWDRFGLPGQPSISCSSPFRPDKSPSFSVYDEGRKWKDHGTDDGGDVIDFLARAGDTSTTEATKRFIEMAGGAAVPFLPRKGPSDAAAMREAYKKGVAAEKARKRALWPAFKRPSDDDVLVVAKLRKLPVEAVDMARACGFLWSATVDGAACFVISEGDHFAQAMRYDGMPFGLPGDPKKKTLPGSLSKGFVGWRTLGDPACPVLIVEGVAGLLEGIAAARAVDADARPGAGWSVLASISCNSRFIDETADVPLFAGRRFRILPDHDIAGTGFRAAAAWQEELQAMGATVDAYRLPPGCKDLGPVVANVEAHLDYLNQFFTI